MNEDKGMACLGLIILSVGIIVVSSIMNGWVLSILWGWFVSPLFGLPTLEIAPAIGFALVVGLLTHQSEESNTKGKDITELIAQSIGEGIFSPLLVLLVGWIVLQFV